MQPLHFGQIEEGRSKRQGYHRGEGYSNQGRNDQHVGKDIMGQEETMNLGGNIEKEITGLKMRKRKREGNQG